ncbi:protease synthase and sporulation protein PAI 2 [Patiriisocius marinus]|uniref:Protease synthase and sporulation protein PAI 2 n=1 Tax=Patiriisocius marinus TaxID=1397112 RepID=A0A5J4IWD5_9FLAO|nr:FMN-binding negative transcriptional regulator [Patiriisocius marinus]GER57901.1 protease synthase and sporulation protein PAI 2 [Patiriisocius marinus]
MFTPNHYKNENIDDAIAFIERFNFGVMISAKSNKPIATHLPFIITKKDDNIVLASHFAKANEQTINIEENIILTIFSEPHAYISPKYYDNKQNVPTWNYIAVHTYGKVEIVEDEKEVFLILEQMISNFDSAYLKQWNDLSYDYKSKMARGIIAFRITIDEIQFKEKLSQNKTEKERKRIISDFSKSNSFHEKTIAEFMDKNEQ